MKALTLFLVLILFFSPVVGAREQSPFLAVFISEDLANNYSDFPHQVGLKVVAKDWKCLDEFLNETVKLAAGRQIILDFSIHGMGEECPVLSVGDRRHSFVGTMGGLMNHIERIVPEKQIEACILESCYGNQVYRGSLNPPSNLIRKIKGCLLEGRGARDPQFKVLGFNGFRNVPPCGIEQYLHKELLTLQDLRGLAPVHLTKQSEEISVLMQRIILDKMLAKDDVFRMRIFY